MSSYKNILVAIDVCDNYQAVVERAKQLAGDGCHICILHVVEPVYYPENYMGGLAVDFQEKSVEFAENELKALATKYQIKPDDCHVTVGKPAGTVHTFAEDKNIDLVIVGSHGKHGLQLLLGSTATSILHGSNCDVLAVRIQD